MMLPTLLRTLAWIGAMACALALAAAPARVHAQQATERYIPLGASPGVSGKHAMTGTVSGYAGSGDEGTLSIGAPGTAATHQVRLNRQTRIWLDRSAAGQSNQVGNWRDLANGRQVEIHYADPATRQVAAWVKVKMP